MSTHYPVTMQLHVQTPMRDGVSLSTDLYLPASPGPFPTVLMRTPYSNNTPELIEKGRRLANAGYACAIQDVRGRWDSGGDYYPMRNEGLDGYDTQEWIGRQPWSNGRIGMAGGSYLGWVQWASAPHRSQHLTCLAPRVMAPDLYRGLIHPGGAFQLGVLITWGMRTNARTGQSIDFHQWSEALRHLPIVDLDESAGRRLQFWHDWVQHPSYDSYWAATNLETQWGEVTAPALNMGGWYDLYAQHTFDCFTGLRSQGQGAARQSKLIIGPWPHALSSSPRTGDIDFGAHSMVDLEALELRWFDHWLKGIENGVTDEPPIRLFIMGSNRWRDEHEWPLARTRYEKWYLHSQGAANTLRGDGTLSPSAPQEEAPDQFVCDPAHPVQTVGGNNCCSPHIIAWGPYDQRSVEMRADVLCYTSAPLDVELEVTGPITVELYAATDGLDTDWTAKLVDVAPSGYARNLCDGIIRARYRESMSEPTLLTPHQVYAYTIDLGVTGNVFQRGHRIRLEIASSNFPRFDRNPNTGSALGMDADLRVARQLVYHDPAHPSHIVLPLIPTGP